MTDEAAKKPPIKLVEPEQTEGEPIKKPGKFDLNAYKADAPGVADVETLLTALPHHRISEARDFVRLHPDESEYWSPELCFVVVPVKGVRRDVLHLILRPLALRYLGRDGYQQFRLALATKPYDVFFLCHVPSTNLDNTWNSTNRQACEAAKERWVSVASGRKDNIDGYKCTFAITEKAFPTPAWPKQSLNDLIGVTFEGRMIDTPDHPALLRLIGDKPVIS